MWNVHFIGNPSAIKRALRTYANNLSDTDREDFREVLPVLERLVDLNMNGEHLSVSLQANCTDGTVSVIMMRSNATNVQ